MIFRKPVFGWGGLNTRAGATGLPLLDCVELQDMRVVGQDLVERYGIVRVGSLTGTGAALDFDGTDDYLSQAINVGVWTLGLYWTVEIVIEPDTASGTMGLLCVGSTTPALILDITGGNIRCRAWDSAGTSTTVTVGAAATSVQTVQISRSTSTLSTRLDGGTAVTGSMSATLIGRTPAGELRVARDDSTNYYNGTVDNLRLLSVAKSHHRDRLVRLPNPRAPHVLADYDMVSSAGGLVYDRSRYCNNLIKQSAPGSVTALCHNPAPVRALSMSVDENQRKQLLMVAGGNYYLAGVD